MTAEALALFGVCRCGSVSPAPGLACEPCVAAAREYIRRTDGTCATDGELAAVLGGVTVGEPQEPPVDDPGLLVAAAVAPGAVTGDPGWRMNQRCWLCEERRKCKPDPEMPGRWICRECEECE